MTPLGTCVKLLWFASSSNQWSLVEDSPQRPDYIICSSPMKWSSAVLLLVTSGCCRISSGWRFAPFCGGCYIMDFIVHVSSYFLQFTLHCSCFVSVPSVLTSLLMFNCYFLKSTVHLIHLTYRSPSRSYLPYLVAFTLHGPSTILSVSLFSQSCLWELAAYQCL